MQGVRLKNSENSLGDRKCAIRISALVSAEIACEYWGINLGRLSFDVPSWRRPMANNAAKIAQLRTILEAGATSVVTDGVTVNYDLEQVRKTLRELEAGDDNQKGKRPVAARIKLSGL